MGMRKRFQPDPEPSPVVQWIVRLVVVLLVYFLTAPPLFWWAVKNNTSASVKSHYEVPQWAHAYSQPYGWVRTNTPLGKPLQSYSDWWHQMFFASTFVRKA